jgi:ABC-type branched-subunit amino acid transport system ATPase component
MKRLSGELGLTILFCEHDMGMVFSIATQIMVMQQGIRLSRVCRMTSATTNRCVRPISEVPTNAPCRKHPYLLRLSHILFDVSLEVGQGEIVCLLGRNGAGKSTTMKSIMGLTPPKKGFIEFKGRSVPARSPT